VASLRQRVKAVAAANRHTVALVEMGHVYSWGCNLQGQLGYGTSDSASNAVPRIVEAMKVGRTQPVLLQLTAAIMLACVHAASHRSRGSKAGLATRFWRVQLL
jgi:alpha-tubulin suppressor-like RCC1 family protein